MRKIKMRLPATLTAFGAALSGLGLAAGLYTQVEVLPRDDEEVIVDPTGEGAGHYALGSRHPVVLGLNRTFAHFEKIPTGMTIRISNNIPIGVGLNAEAAFMVAGIVAANNLLDTPFSRQELIGFIAKTAGVAGAAALLGGLVSSVPAREGALPTVTHLPLTAFKLIVAVPEQKDYKRPALPQRVDRDAVLANLERLPLLLNGLRTGDIAQISGAMDDALLSGNIAETVKGYVHVAEVARLAGVTAVTTSGGGPTMVFLCEDRHDRIAEVIETAFGNLDIAAKVMVLALDTQGITLSISG